MLDWPIAMHTSLHVELKELDSIKLYTNKNTTNTNKYKLTMYL